MCVVKDQWHIDLIARSIWIVLFSICVSLASDAMNGFVWQVCVFHARQTRVTCDCCLWQILLLGDLRCRGCESPNHSPTRLSSQLQAVHLVDGSTTGLIQHTTAWHSMSGTEMQCWFLFVQATDILIFRFFSVFWFKNSQTSFFLLNIMYLFVQC